MLISQKEEAVYFNCQSSFFLAGPQEAFSWWRAYVKMSATIVGRRRKILKLHWIKRPKTVPQKSKFGPENKLFKISYQEFINFRFSVRKSQSQQKLAKKVTHFTIQFQSKNLIYFTKLNIVKKIFSRNTTKNLSLQFFQQTCFWLVSEKTFSLCNFQTPKNCILEGFGKQICSRDVESIYLVGC